MTRVDPLDTKAQERVNAARIERERLTSEQEIADFKWLMSDKRGRRFLMALLDSTGCFRNPFTGNSETFFRCGEQNVGQRYLAMINDHCPDKYNLMITEQREHDRPKR